MTEFITNVREKKFKGFSGTCFLCSFSADYYTDKLARTLLGENILKPVARAVPKRKSEFVVGRYLAKKALRNLDAKSLNVEIGDNREPLWPEFYRGSISHSDSEAVCLVGKSELIQAIGIDIETIIDYEIAVDIYSNIVLKQEVIHVGSKLSLDPTMFTLIFSAKESLFKALYPQVKYYFEFDVAQVNTIDMESCQFTIELTQNLTPYLPKGSVFEGVFEISNDRVLTMITF